MYDIILISRMVVLVEKKAFALRVPVGLFQVGKRFADERGQSFNAFVCMAIAEYVDRNWGRPMNNLRKVDASVPVSVPELKEGAGKRFVEPAGGRNAPCPCGSGKKWKVCHMQ